jgi:DNA-directed RNA polymerase specialized sigma24 family protein
LLQRGFVEHSPAATAAFLRTTARHLFLRRNRHLLPQVEAADVVWQRHCGEGDGQGYVNALEVCLGQLVARARQLVDACYRDDMGRDAIAAELGMTAHGVKTALRRIRATLKSCIERRLARRLD